MPDPLAFFMTWATYGSWLPGDERGWVEYHGGWRLPDPILHLESSARMSEDACRLTPAERLAVEHQMSETCEHRGWVLHAVNCRSNHIHVVASAPDTHPNKIRRDLKAWATRCLRAFDPIRKHWWEERGSIRHVTTDQSLEAAILYTREGQDGRSPAHRPGQS